MTDRKQAILKFLRKYPDRSMTEIAVHLGVRPSAVDITVRRMVFDGLVRTDRKPNGRHRYSASTHAPSIKPRKPSSETARLREAESAHANVMESARQHSGPFGILVAQITK